MNVSKKWLNAYVNIADISAEVLAEKLTDAGLEVEGISTLASGTQLVIGEVIECEAHPDSDHLSMTKVNIGREVLSIVCGAPNVAKGQKVIVATVGAVLPEITIKAATVRGVDSFGMICSLAELGVAEKYLSESSKEGIEVLPADAPIGADALEYLGLDDKILDVKQTPNRNDFMSMWSIAKEVGAIFNREVKWPSCDCASTVGVSTELTVSSESVNCSRFLGKKIGSVTLKPSPAWMREHLMAAGIKSINNVVDISNYVMIETGQPLHFYDTQTLPSLEITVKDGLSESFVTLDEETVEIVPEDLIITSGGISIGLAGIMGGQDSKISEDTTSIVIEVASFDPVTIRNTSRRLNLNTDASSRFIKGIEPYAPFKAMDRAVELLITYADATLIEETVMFGPQIKHDKKVSVSVSHVNGLLGTKLTKEEIVSALARLHFEPTIHEDVIECSIPSYRMDIDIAEDLIEEVIRMIGYDAIESVLPQLPQTVGALTPEQTTLRMIREYLSIWGLQEAITYTLVSEEMTKGLLALDNPTALASPLSEDRKYVRNSLTHSLLDVVAYNQAHKNASTNFFEVSMVYGDKKPQWHLGVALSADLSTNSWQKSGVKADFYTLKGLLEGLFAQLGFEGTRLRLTANDQDQLHLHPYRSGVYLLGKEVLAVFGEVHPAFAKQMGVKNTLYAEVNVDVLLQQTGAKIKFAPLNKFPKVTRDVALVVDEKVEVETLMTLIRKEGRPLVQSVDVFDIFASESLGEHKKSVALKVVYQSKDKTLVESEIVSVHQKILDALAKVGASLR